MLVLTALPNLSPLPKYTPSSNRTNTETKVQLWQSLQDSRVQINFKLFSKMDLRSMNPSIDKNQKKPYTIIEKIPVVIEWGMERVSYIEASLLKMNLNVITCSKEPNSENSKTRRLVWISSAMP